VMTGSYKFGGQMQFVLYAKKGQIRVEERSQYRDYSRIEVAMPIDDGIELINKMGELVNGKGNGD